MSDYAGDLSEDELLIKIGRELTERDIFMAPPSKRVLLKKGQRWFEKHYIEFEKAICLNEEAKALLNSADTDTPTILTAVADLISSICIGVSPFTVAQLLLTRGLKVLCKKHW